MERGLARLGMDVECSYFYRAIVAMAQTTFSESESEWKGHGERRESKWKGQGGKGEESHRSARHISSRILAQVT